MKRIMIVSCKAGIFLVEIPAGLSEFDAYHKAIEILSRRYPKEDFSDDTETVQYAWQDELLLNIE